MTELLAALEMGMQLAESGGHDGENESCPTCHFYKAAKEALDGFTGGPAPIHSPSSEY